MLHRSGDALAVVRVARGGEGLPSDLWLRQLAEIDRRVGGEGSGVGELQYNVQPAVSL